MSKIENVFFFVIQLEAKNIKNLGCEEGPLLRSTQQQGKWLLCAAIHALIRMILCILKREKMCLGGLKMKHTNSRYGIKNCRCFASLYKMRLNRLGVLKKRNFLGIPSSR